MINRTKDEPLILGDIDRRIREAVQVASRFYSDVRHSERTELVSMQIDSIVSRALRDLDEDLTEFENMRCV